MKKIFKLLAAAIIIYFITASTLPRLMPAATLKTSPDSEVMYQTWEEFLESGVTIEHDEVTSATDRSHYLHLHGKPAGNT